ncbi:MAG: TIGR01212 family radical SAM protein, partial [Lachnospira sp.]|nr:TIGR01212 family radical SAM protein [Lachnospira sp.]
MKDTYGEKMYKLSLNGGMTCPNRDGLIDTRGCIFCSAGGSGDFAGDAVNMKQLNNLCQSPTYTDYIDTIPAQISSAKSLIFNKYSGTAFIAYFQSYTNTYADTDYLHRLFYPVIMRDDIRILSIATRPDCLSDSTIELLAQLNQIKPVWVELGLQTIHEKTAEYIRRGYKLPVFESAVSKLLSV